MEVRLLVAYAIMFVVGFVGSVGLVAWSRRRKAHQRRMRGIKTPPRAMGSRRTAG